MDWVGLASASTGRSARRSWAPGFGRRISAVLTSRRRRLLSSIGIKYGAEVDGRSAGSKVDPWSARDMEAVGRVVAEGGERLFFFFFGTSGRVDLYVGIKFRRRGAFLLWTGKSRSFLRSLLRT